MIIKDKPELPPGQPCIVWDGIAALIVSDPFISDVPTRIKWLRKRHKPTKRLVKWWKQAKAAAMRAA